MERLDKPEAKGILAFLGSTPPKSAEDAEKERKERESPLAGGGGAQIGFKFEAYHPWRGPVGLK